MNLAPASLGGRLLLAAAVFITVALLAAAGLTGLVLDRFIHRQIDLQLDGQILAITSALVVGPDGHLTLSRSVDVPPFDAPFSGWYWQVDGGPDRLRSPSLMNAVLDVPPPHPHPPFDRGREAVSDGPGPRHEPLHFRIARQEIDGRPVAIVATAPGRAFDAPLGEAMTAVSLSLAIAGLVLILAMVLQVRLGLRPLDRLRAAVADVRAGRRDSVPADQPSEIAPLVGELNSLIAENAEGLARARRHVANLAHGLKTPLASLAIALEEPGRDPGGALHRLTTLMDRRIRHHLGRARAAALGGAARAETPLRPRVADLVASIEKIYADKKLAVAIDIAAGLTVACEAQDLDEMLGNLVDNAGKWAARQLRIGAEPSAGTVVIAIEDDGPGLLEDKVPDVLRPGRKLDESAPGYGFGLPITRELAELYGGGLALARSGLGGVKAILTLPAAR